MKRVFTASMHHESNSFNPIIAGESEFSVIRGAEIFNRFKENDAATGIIKTLLAAGYEVVPSVFTSAVPNGEVDIDFYNKIKKEIIEAAVAENKRQPLDAAALALHGSMYIHGLGDAEGFLLEELRAALPEIPIFCSLDTHTTMTQRMHDNADGFAAFKCAPHTDRYETGVKAAEMTIAALERGVKAKSAWVRVPFLVAGEKSSSTVEPMRSLAEKTRAAEREPGILAASYLMGFPWCDNENSSAAVYVTAENQALADECAIRLAEELWARRDDFCFQTETYSEAEALDAAFEGVRTGGPFPIYLSDSGDNPTAGSTSDCTGFLRRIMEDSRTDELETPVVFGGIYDPEATLLCRDNVGQELTLTFGAKFDRSSSVPITAKGTVLAYIKGWNKFHGVGDIALFRSCGVDIVLSENHIGYGLPAVFGDLGRNPADMQIVVCKLGYLTAQQAAYAKRSIMALSKGSTNEDLTSLDYRHIPRPIFPLDTDFSFEPAENLIRKTK